VNAPTVATVKRLFGLSGNRCAFPKCPLPVIESESGKPVGRICHIRAQNPRGPRYDRTQTDAERHAFENLILLCPIHHDVIDSDEEAYTAERLERMKSDHEERNSGGQDAPDDVARELITLSANDVTQGSILLSLQQTGGQVAHSITNVYGSSVEAARRLHEKQVEVFATMWQKLTETYRYAEQIGNGVLRAPNLNSLNEPQFSEFVRLQPDMKDWEKDELRFAADKSTYFRNWYWWWLANRARDQWRDLYQYIQATRIFIDDDLKALIAEATSLMSQIFVRAEVAKSYADQNFDKAFATYEQLQPKMTELEALISSRLYGRA
jgi:hypothetical protein